MRTRFKNTLLATTAVMPLVIVAALANPLGSQVVGGAANVQGQGTSTVTVTQSTDKAIINWQSFNIGSGETTTFMQPNASSITLNRVTGNLGPSFLDGTLTANGRVFLVNPDGILFGAGSRINTGSFLATTNDIRNADFMAGRYQFNLPGRPDASIVNLGTITAQSGGFAALVAPGVRNTGTITANLGTVGLAAGNNFSLDFYGDRLITLGVNDSIAAKVIDVATGQPLNSLVKNEGKLTANGGRVELTAAAARQVVDSVINNTGIIEANSIGTKNGLIVLGAATGATKPAGAPTQTIKLSGKISAAGKGKNTKGGTIVVTGENIQLASATIDASGQAGGGKVLIGGDVGGGKGNAAVAANSMATLESFAIPTASTVSVDVNTVINASAQTTGNGGKVVVWSDQATTFYGTIKAQGGAQSGNGGFAEVSSHGLLSYRGLVDLRGQDGEFGTLLLDPADFYILAAGAPAAPAGASSISNIQLQNQLATSDVVIATDSTVYPAGQHGDIFVNAPITWSTGSTLTLSAFRDIQINSAINAANGGLTLDAAGAISDTGAVALNIFNLQSGNWSQVASNLPTFSANDFRIGNPSFNFGPPPTFVRALGGDGTTSAPYQITDVYGLQGIGTGQSAVLANNIDASITAGWNSGAGFIPIATSTTFSPTFFSAVFDGLNQSISNLTIASAGYNVGLFAAIGSEGIVRNVSLTGANISATGSSGASRLVGVLAGLNNGTISNVSVVNSNVVIPSGFAGGLVGDNGGTINHSTSSATVTANDPTVSGFVSVGGLAGSNDSGGIVPYNNTGLITDSSATGAVSIVGSGAVGGLVGSNQATISQSFATGSVHGGIIVANFGPPFASTAGGLVGENSGSISDSHASGPVSGDLNSTAGGLVGANAYGDGIPSVLRSYATGAASVGDGGTAGGLLGINGGTLTQTFATGPVNGGSSSIVGGLVGANTILWTVGSPVTISQSYATGPVTGGANSKVGGLVAVNQGSTISESYAVGSVNGAGNSIVGGLVAVNSPVNNSNPAFNAPGVIINSYTTSQLPTGLPSGFDDTVWTIKPGVSNPYFPWQPANTIPAATPRSPTLPPSGVLTFPIGQTAFFTPTNTQVANSTPQTSPLPNFETITGGKVYVSTAPTKDAASTTYTSNSSPDIWQRIASGTNFANTYGTSDAVFKSGETNLEITAIAAAVGGIAGGIAGAAAGGVGAVPGALAGAELGVATVGAVEFGVGVAGGVIDAFQQNYGSGLTQIVTNVAGVLADSSSKVPVTGGLQVTGSWSTYFLYGFFNNVPTTN
jgi:filamentous hemagglutinin family protein